LEQIALAISHDLIVLSDEIYSRILYDGEFHSMASLPGMLNARLSSTVSPRPTP
jgi:aspartate/methionine/tyrosine aminotransferase